VSVYIHILHAASRPGEKEGHGSAASRLGRERRVWRATSRLGRCHDYHGGRGGCRCREDKGGELQRMEPMPARIGCPTTMEGEGALHSAPSHRLIQPSKSPSAAPSRRRRRSAPFPLSTFYSSLGKSTRANTAARGPSRRQTLDLAARNGDKCEEFLLRVAGLSRRWMLIRYCGCQEEKVGHRPWWKMSSGLH
jgi:hypothetical protein